MDKFINIRKIFQQDFFNKSSSFSISRFFKGRRTKKTFKILSYILVGFVLMSLICDFGKSKALDLNLGVNDITGGYSEFNKIDNINGTSLALQKGNLGTWTNGDTVPLDVPESSYLPDMQYGPNNTLYLLPGSGAGTFKRYWIEERRWEDLAPLPFGNFTKLSYDGSRYFYTLANTGTNFYRYDCFNNDWEKLAETPDLLDNGSNLEFVNRNGGEVYAFRGGSSGYFWRYTVGANSWEELPAANLLINTGSAMMWDRSDYLYVVRGNYNYRLYRYQISTGAWVDRGYFYSAIYEGASSRMIFMDTNNFLMMNSAGALNKYSAVTNTFTSIGYPTGASSVDLAGAYDGVSKFYAFICGYSSTRAEIRVYDFSTGKWDNNQMTANTPIYYYTAWAYDNADTLYEINYTGASKLNLTTGVNVGLSPPPVTITSYPSAVYTGGKVYVTRGSGYGNFYSYDVASGDWDSELAPMPAAVYDAATLADGGDGYLYLPRGGGNTTFYRYQISANIWTTIAAAPFAISNSGGIVKVDNTIYAFSGSSNSGRIAIFNLNTQTWSEDLAAIGPVGWPGGSRLASDGSSTIYFIPGQNGTLTDYQRRVYSYNVTTKVWTRLADTPDYERGASVPYLFYRQGSLFLSKGDYDNRIYRWDPTAAAYQTDSTWFSKHYDLTQVSSFDQLDYSSSGTGTVTISTRTSDNGASWDAWTPLSGIQIASTPRRYFQFKVRIQGDSTQTPTVSDFSISYSQESDPPSLPSELHAYSELNGQALVTGATNTYHHPYFTWLGADDGLNGSGVEGYYVYFGTDSNADPATVGSYQETTNYTADVPMVAGDVFYLKIKVKDKLGNISESGPPFFSYRYWFVSPPTSADVGTQAQFAEGTGQGLDLSSVDGSAKLVSKPTGSWADGDLAKIPATFKGGAVTYASGSIYTLTGNNTKLFYRFDLDANQWASLADAPTASPSATSGSVLYFDGTDTIYYITGSSSTAFSKYSISRNIWTSLSLLPSPAGQEAAMTKITGGKFLVSLVYSTYNYIYDPQTDDFTENVPCPGNFVSASNLIFDGTDTVYTVTEFNWLRKFVISENRWYTIMQAPFNLMDTQNIGFDSVGSNIYFFYNRNSQGYTAVRYSITDNRFYPVSSPSMETTSGDYIVSDQNRFIYIFHNTLDGARQDNFFVKYDTVNDRYTPDLYNPQKGYFFDRNTSYNLPTYATEESWQFYASDWSSGTFDGADSIYFKSYNFIIEYSVSQQKMIREGRLSVPDYGSITYVDGYIYYAQSSSTKRFHRMNVKTWEWQELANTPDIISTVQSNNMVADKEGRIYVAKGGSSNLVYRYTPGTNSWETLPNAPTTLNNGLSMVYDGNNNIYFTFSTSSSSFYYFSVSGNAWGQLAVVPDAKPGAGATSVYQNGKIYLAKGGNSKKLAIYDSGTDSWSYGPDAPTEVNRGAIFIKPNETYALLSPGGNKAAVWRYNFPGANVDCNAYGVYTSKNFLIDGVFSFVNIEATVDTPVGTSIEFQTRTTDDGTNWTSWADTSQTKTAGNKIYTHINSPVKKNIQVKAILQSYDSYAIPTLNDFRVNVYADTSPPSNPTMVKLYTDPGKSTELTNNTWYNTVAPFIDWPDPGQAGGATDGNIGSNIKGYYIYFGTTESTIPETGGVFVDASQYQPTLTTPGLYYVRIQAVDGSNNIATDVYQGYLYKFDNEKPEKPSVITVDPGGYTINNAFTFSWETAVENYSGIREYCYRTAATSGLYSTEQCQSGTRIENLPVAYQNGSNKIMVRSHDYAGNYSESATEATFYFKDTANSQDTEVTNLQVDTLGANIFSFSWDLPLVYVGNADKMAYYYSINAQPNATNTTRVEARTTGGFKAATQPGTNVFYVVARDEATDYAHINWAKSSNISYFSNTIAPGIPLNLAISDISSRSYSRWGLALTWDIPTNLGSGVNHYSVERSDDKVHFSGIVTVSSPTYVDNNVTENQNYYYRVKASDEVGNYGGASTIVNAAPVGKYTSAPKISSEPNVAIGSNQATITWSTDRPAIGYVIYGSIHDELIDSSGSQDTVSDHTVNLKGLAENTVYYYELQNLDQNRDYDVDQTFSTIQAFKTLSAPVISNVKISGVTLNEAKITFSASGIKSYKVSYGKTDAYGLNKESNNVSDGEQSVTLSALENTSTYHFKVVYTTINDDQIYSDDYSFTTIAYPVISNVRFEPIDGSAIGVMISWKTNEETTTAVSYQFGGEIKDKEIKEYTLDHKITIDGLLDNQEYKITAKGTDKYNNATSSEPQVWKSGIDTKPADIAKITAESNINIDNEKTQIIVTWETDEPSSSQLEYGKTGDNQKYENKTVLDAELTKNHVVVVNDVESAQTYHVRPSSIDRAGNVAYGEDTIVAVTQPDRSVLQLILNAIKNIFGWMKL